MAKTDITTIKTWFKTGLKPSQIQFWNTWDSFWHKDEKLPISSIDGLGNAIDGKANANHTHNDYATNDASSLSSQDIVKWKEALEVDLDFIPLKGTEGTDTIEGEFALGSSVTYTVGSYSDITTPQYKRVAYGDVFNPEAGVSAFQILPTGSVQTASSVLGTTAVSVLRNGVDISYMRPDKRGRTEIILSNNSLLAGVALDSQTNGFEGNQTMMEMYSFGKTNNFIRVSQSGIEHAGDFLSPTNFYNANQRFSGLVDKSSDATYNVFPILDGNGNLAKASNSYYALLNSLTLMTPTQKVNIMKLFNGQYSSGQIKTDMILMPVIEIGDNLSGVSKLDIYGSNLLIDPDTSYVRIKEFGNVDNWEDCIWNNVDSTRLEVFVNNSFLEIGKTYVFEIKHSVQVHTTVLSIDVVQQLDNVDLNTLTYTITKDEANNADDYLDISVGANGLISHSVKKQAPENLRGKILKKIRTNPIAQYSENLVIIIDFNWGYGTGAFEFPRYYDKMGLSKVIQYTENDVSDNIVAGVATGYLSFNSSDPRTSIIGGGFIGKSGIGQCIIVKKGGIITTVLMMNGNIIRYSSNATVTENYAIEFNFLGRYLNPKSVGTYNISLIQKF